MHIEVVQALRCPVDHEASWLVARTDRLEARHIAAGVLGCPVCGREYPVVDGVLRLAAAIETSSEDLGPEAAVRVAALLDLTSPGGLVLLAGSWASVALELSSLTEGTHVLALDDAGETPPFGLGVSRLDAGAMVPLGEGVARGVALDRGHATEECVASAARALKSRGRLVSPSDAAVPDSLEELARDDRWWVAERPAVTRVVPIAGLRR